MSITLSAYQAVSQTFLDDHPPGTVVTDAQILDWAKKHKNGLAPDLAVPDPKKRLGSIRRHLNDGASVNGLPEDRRFRIEIVDATTGRYLVRTWSEHILDKANSAFARSVTGAINPLKNSKRAIDAINLDELPAKTRELLKARREEIVEAGKPLAQVYSAQLTEQWVGRLESTGITRDQAALLLQQLPTMTRESRLQKLLSSL